jgi:hypothetical protein
MSRKFLRYVGALWLAGWCASVFAASMTVTYAPSNTAGDGAAVTATVAYAGVAALGTGTQVIVCYDNSKLTFGAVTYASPPGESQPALEGAAGALCVAPANRQIALNYVSFGNTWPSSPSASGTLAASGNLASITFTTANPFNGSTSLVATENTALGGNYALGSATGTLTKLLPATAATFTATPTPLTFNEGGAAQNITVACSGTIGTPSPVAITVGTTGTGFTAVTTTLNFATCPSSQTVAVTPRAADAISNPQQTGTVTFATATSGATAPAAVNVAVNDLQTPATYSITKATATVTEGNVATDTIVVTCTGTLTAATGTVSFTLGGAAVGGGTDFTASPASPLNFATCAGATQAITFSPRTNDAIVQGVRTGTVALTGATGGTLSGVTAGSFTVNDDDTPQVVTVAVAGSPATEASGVLTYTFTRAGGNAAAQAAVLSFNITPPAVSGRYSTTCSSPLTFALNTPTASCTVTGIDNNVLDGNVNVAVAVAGPTVVGSYTVGASGSATGVIVDDDVAVNAVAGATGSAVASTVPEGAVVRFSVSCPTLVAPATFNYAITPALTTGDVFAGGLATGSVTCPAAAAANVAIPTVINTINDLVIGNGRAYTMTLSVPSSQTRPGLLATVIGTRSATVSVLDDDVPTVIPTMNAVGLGLMSLMLIGFAAFQRRRRQ